MLMWGSRFFRAAPARLGGILQQGRHFNVASTQNAAKVPQEPLSIDEALFLAQMGGVSTVKELQKQIMTAPSFSPNKSPFLLEDFYDTMEDKDSPDPLDISAEMDDIDAFNKTSNEEYMHSLELTSEKIHNLLKKNFNPKKMETFFHQSTGKPMREFLVESEGKGTRKRASVHVALRRGTGQIKFTFGGKSKTEEAIYHRINQKQFLYARFDIIQPFFETGTCGLYDVWIHAKGGGPVGQALAARLAISRALLAACPDVLPDLNKDGLLKEDLTQKMPKMIGRYKARAQMKFSKR